MFYGLFSKNFDQKPAKVSILDYAQKNQFLVGDFLSVITLPLREGHFALQNGEGSEIGVNSGDVLIVPNLSYFGLNLLKSLASCVSLGGVGVQIHFIEQPELSICGDNFAKTLSIFKSMLKSEKGFISARAKAGMKAAKANGAKLGRPKGISKKAKTLDNHKSEIIGYLQKDISVVAVMKIINNNLDQKLSYFTFKNYVNVLRGV